MKLVLFDLDGTLTNAGPTGASALDNAVKNLFGRVARYDVKNLAGKTDRWNFNYVYKETFKKTLTPKQFKLLRQEYFKLLKQEVAAAVKAKKYKAMAGIEPLLKTLAANKNICLALGTGNLPQAAEIKLAPLGLNKYFKTGGFGDSAADRVALLQNAVKNAQKFFKTKFTPADVYIVGDTHIDIAAAKELGFHSAAVTAGALGDKDRLLRAAAELQEKDFKNTALWLMWLDLKADPKGVEKGSYIMPASAIEHVFFSRTGIDEQRLKMFRIKKYSDIESGKLI